MKSPNMHWKHIAALAACFLRNCISSCDSHHNLKNKLAFVARRSSSVLLWPVLPSGRNWGSPVRHSSPPWPAQSVVHLDSLEQLHVILAQTNFNMPRAKEIANNRNTRSPDALCADEAGCGVTVAETPGLLRPPHVLDGAGEPGGISELPGGENPQVAAHGLARAQVHNGCLVVSLELQSEEHTLPSSRIRHIDHAAEAVLVVGGDAVGLDWTRWPRRPNGRWEWGWWQRGWRLI